MKNQEHRPEERESGQQTGQSNARAPEGKAAGKREGKKKPLAALADMKEYLAQKLKGGTGKATRKKQVYQGSRAKAPEPGPEAPAKQGRAVPPERAAGPAQASQETRIAPAAKAGGAEGEKGAGGLGGKMTPRAQAVSVALSRSEGEAHADARPQEGGKGKKKRHKVKKLKVLKYVLLNLLKAGVCMACLGIIVGCIAAVVVFQYVMAETVNSDNILQLEDIHLSYTSYIYAKDPVTGEWDVENPYQELVGDEHRIWVDISEIPEDLIQAVIATEDRNFETHSGVNFTRTIYAAVNEVLELEDESFGASTVTQQLVKNITGDDEVTYTRKIKEMIRALLLDANYSKDMIMEAYLNTMGLSERLAGVQAGAQAYFGKDVSELTLWECATIAGITQYPSAYSPFRNPEDCLERRDNVIWFMLEVGYITQAEADYAWSQPLGVIDPNDRTEEEVKADTTFTYFTDQVFNDVLRDLQNQFNYTRAEALDMIYNGGLRIYASVDVEMQAILEDLYYNGYNEDGYFFTHFAESGDYKAKLTIVEDILNEAGNKTGTREVLPQSAVVVMRYDGSLAAVVGGIGEKEGKLGLNRATQSKRQVGSTIKPIGPYGIALDYGVITYSTSILDAPVMFSNPSKPSYNAETGAPVYDWPRNVSNRYRYTGLPVVSAISESTNTIAVRVGQIVGVRQMFDFMHDTLQISSLVESGDSNDLAIAPLTLGSLTDGITPYELAAAYSIYGNGGVYNTPHSYEMVTDANGKVIMRPETNKTQAVSQETAFIMNKILGTVIDNNAPAGVTGTGRYYKLESDVPAVGKSGTTSDDRDRWWVGLTPEYVTAVWWGYDQDHTFWPGTTTASRLWPTGKANVPGNVWKTIMDTYYESHDYGAFPEQPETVVERTFCLTSGDLAGPYCTSKAVGYYNAEFLDDLHTCTYHNGEQAEG